MNSWREEPVFELVQSALKDRGIIKAKIEAFEAELKILQAQMSQKQPRNTSVKIIGIDQESSERLIGLQKELAYLYGSLAKCEAEIDFNKFHLELFKALAYKERF